MEEYFPRPLWLQMMREPMRSTQNEGRFTISAKVVGGGPSGQAGAVQLGLARALVAADETFQKGTTRQQPS